MGGVMAAFAALWAAGRQFARAWASGRRCVALQGGGQARASREAQALSLTTHTPINFIKLLTT